MTTTETTSTDNNARIPDNITGVAMTPDGSGILHCLAPPFTSELLVVDREYRPGGIVYVAMFRAICCGISPGDPVQIMPEARGPN